MKTKQTCCRTSVVLDDGWFLPQIAQALQKLFVKALLLFQILLQCLPGARRRRRRRVVVVVVVVVLGAPVVGQRLGELLQLLLPVLHPLLLPVLVHRVLFGQADKRGVVRRLDLH